jgi:serpin B
MKKIILPFVIFVSLTSLAQDQPIAAEINSIANANNKLAFDLYTEICEKEKGNVFYCLFSISAALAMTYAGSTGATEKEMAQVLHFLPNTPLFHQNFGAYMARLAKNAKGNIEFEMANRLWIEKNFNFKKEFFDLVNSAYGASTLKADFINNYEVERKLINEWVAKKTKNRIKDLIPRGVLDADTRMVLVNAIYFKGDWLYPFDSLETRNDVFHVEKGKDVTARFMKQTGYFNYASGEYCKMIRLPYKGDK